MRITCRSCFNDVLLPDEQIDPRGMRSSCTHCGTVFEILPLDEDGQPRIVFASDREKLRTCIECGRSFSAESDDVIPVCDNCRRSSGEAAPLEVVKDWKLLRPNRTISLETDASVREWVRRGEIQPDDTLIAPDGTKQHAKKFSQLADAFRDRRKKNRLDTSSATRAPRMRFRFVFLIQFLAILAGVALSAWTIYRLVTIKVSTKVGPPAELIALAKQLSEKTQPPDRPAGALVEQARQLMSSDDVLALEKARGLLEQAIVQDPAAVDAAGLYAECYALLSAYSELPAMHTTALELAALIERVAPERPDGAIARTRAALGTGSLELALDASQRAVELGPLVPRAQLARAAAVLRTANSPSAGQEAEASAKRAMSADGLLLESYDLLGLALQHAGELLEARATFERRLARSPEDGLAMLRQAEIEQRARHWKEAQDWLEQALRHKPHLVKARFELAILLRHKLNQPDLAERHLREITTRYRRFATPDDLFETERELALLLARTSRPAESVEELSRLSSPLILPDRVAQVKAEVYFALNKMDDALVEVQKALVSQTEDASLKLLEARLLSRTSDKAKAVQAFRDAVKLKPDELESYLALIHFLVSQGQLDEALDSASAAVARAGMVESQDMEEEFSKVDSRSDPLAELLASAGQIRKKFPRSGVGYALEGLIRLREGLTSGQRNLIADSLDFFERARTLERSAEYPSIYLGRALIALDRNAQAEAPLREALRRSPTSEPADFWLATIKLRTPSRAAEAEATLQRLLESPQWGPAAAVQLGLAQKKSGKSDLAMTTWKTAFQRNNRYVPLWQVMLARD